MKVPSTTPTSYNNVGSKSKQRIIPPISLHFWPTDAAYLCRWCTVFKSNTGWIALQDLIFQCERYFLENETPIISKPLFRFCLSMNLSNLYAVMPHKYLITISFCVVDSFCKMENHIATNSYQMTHSFFTHHWQNYHWAMMSPEFQPKKYK